MSDIAISTAQLSHEDSAFGFYDLHLTEYEQYLLSQVNVAHDYNVLVSSTPLIGL